MKTSRKLAFLGARAPLAASVLAAAWALALAGCGHSPSFANQGTAIKVSSILRKVNDAIAAANDQQGDDSEAPEIVSVQLDMQIGTTTDVSAGLPILMIFPQGKLSSDETHKLSLTFVPTPIEGPMDPKKADLSKSRLAAAISEIYRSVAQGNVGFAFKGGSIQVQCMFEQGISAGTEGGGGSGGGSGGGELVPIQIGASITHQTVHTLTLTFGPKGNTASALKGPQPGSPAPASPAAPAGAAAPKS
jgi:hypothetical protein